MTSVRSEAHLLTRLSGLRIHPPNPAAKDPVPLYSLVRSSATGTNHDWFQTNIASVQASAPQWAARIRQATQKRISKVESLEPIDTDSDSDDSDDNEPENKNVVRDIHQYRYRIWGLVSSPGGATTAVLVSKYNTQYPERRGASRIYFDWKLREDEGEPAGVAAPVSNMTTEGRVWQWMYGNGQPVDGTTKSNRGSTLGDASDSPVRALLDAYAADQQCVFCNSPLENDGSEARCANDHSFGKRITSLKDDSLY
jgi:hypothetical protein